MSKPQFHIGIKNSVSADAGGVCELHFLDAIQNKETFDWYSGVTTTSLLQEVIEQVNAAKPKKIIQHIDSWGGDADLGMGIYNFLKSYPAKVETRIVNKAASAATCMSCAGGYIEMPRNGFYVIHQAQNYAAGTAADLRAAADVADKYTDAYCDVYALNNRKGKTAEEIKALIANGDYWMTGTQAKEMGFIDDFYNDEAVTVTASIEAAKAIYGDKVPQHILQMGVAPIVEATADTDKNFFNQILTEMKSFKEMVTAALSGKKVTAKVGDTMEADITAAITPIFAEMAAEIETEVTAEIAGVKESVTAEVTASMEEKYGSVITAQATTISDLQKLITDLTADVTRIAGRTSPAMGVDANAEGKKTLTGTFR